ncbi:unnamed protein product [Durusdinium trenchii]|uniref:Uncharacterized protein n=1 Tax=Durusdinium trenchii TaxID=1381693 RepID=A0ABP0QZF6_9DINO
MARGAEEVPEASALRATWEEVRQQLEQKKLQLQHLAVDGQELLLEEDALRRSLEECHQELESREETTTLDPLRVSKLQQLEQQNQFLANELEEMESQLRSGRSPKSRGRRELHGAAEGAEALRSELGEVKATEEAQEARWHLEERTWNSELKEVKEQDRALLSALEAKLRGLVEANQLLQEELHREEEKTRQKTTALSTEVLQLRQDLWLHSPSERSELWSGADGSSRRSSKTSSRGSTGTRRSATASFKPLEEIPSLAADTAVTATTATTATTAASVEAAATVAMAAARRASAVVGGLVDDALLSMGDLMEPKEPKATSDRGVQDPKLEVDQAETAATAASSAASTTWSEFWASGSRHSASALEHFGQLLQQQVNSAAEGLTTRPSRQDDHSR